MAIADIELTDIDRALELAFFECLKPMCKYGAAEGLYLVGGYSELLEPKNRDEGEDCDDDRDLATSKLPELGWRTIGFQFGENLNTGSVTFEMEFMLMGCIETEGGDGIREWRELEQLVSCFLRSVRKQHIAEALKDVAQVQSIRWVSMDRGIDEEGYFTRRMVAEVMLIDPKLSCARVGR